MTQITRTVTWDDLIAQYDDDLDALRDQFEETIAHAESEYGDERADWPEHVQQEVMLLNQSKAQIDQRVTALDNLRDEYDGDTFEIKLLSGNELADIETELRAEATRRDVDKDQLDAARKRLAVDAATVRAPDGFPQADSPKNDPAPSDAPNPITMALYELVERLNNTGTTDFRAQGFDDPRASGPRSGLSGGPTSSGTVSNRSAPTDDSTPDSGEP